MAVVKTLKKEGKKIFFADGSNFAVGQKKSLGLGSIELRQTPKKGLQVVRFSGSGQYKYSLLLNRDGEYRLGPSYGHRVCKPEEEKNPLKRVLREEKISLSSVKIMEEGEVLDITRRSCDIWRYSHPKTTWWWYTDGKEDSRVVSSENSPWNQFASPDVYLEGKISMATYAIKLIERVHMNSSISKNIGEVVIWPGCDPATLKEAIASLMK